MNPEVLAIANQWQLWIACAPVVIMVVIQAAWFVQLCKKEADYLGYDRKNLNRAVQNGAVAAIGPAFAGFVVMIGMMAKVGGPITWQRLSIIGAAQTELTAATLGAQAMGLDLGGPGYDVSALTLGFLCMAVNGCGWLSFTAIFTGSLESFRQKLSGGDPRWLSILSSGITCGLFANMVSQQLLAGKGKTVAVVVGFLCQYVLDMIVAKKVPAIKGISLVISLVLALVVAAIVYPA